MGRITRSFRMNFQEELRSLRRTFRDALREPKRREAFDSVVKAWSSEQGAMSYAKVVTVLDVMLLTAVVDNRKLIKELFYQIGLIGSKLDNIQKHQRKVTD